MKKKASGKSEGDSQRMENELDSIHYTPGTQKIFIEVSKGNVDDEVMDTEPIMSGNM